MLLKTPSPRPSPQAEREIEAFLLPFGEKDRTRGPCELLIEIGYCFDFYYLFSGKAQDARAGPLRPGLLSRQFLQAETYALKYSLARSAGNSTSFSAIPRSS